MHQLGNRELFERNVNIEHQTLYIYFSAILDVPSNEKFVNCLHVTQFVACAEKEVLSELQVHFFFWKKISSCFLEHLEGISVFTNVEVVIPSKAGHSGVTIFRN